MAVEIIIGEVELRHHMVCLFREAHFAEGSRGWRHFRKRRGVGAHELKVGSRTGGRPRGGWREYFGNETLEVGLRGRQEAARVELEEVLLSFEEQELGKLYLACGC